MAGVSVKSGLPKAMSVNGGWQPRARRQTGQGRCQCVMRPCHSRPCGDRRVGYGTRDEGKREETL